MTKKMMRKRRTRIKTLKRSGIESTKVKMKRRTIRYHKIKTILRNSQPPSRNRL